MGDLISPKRTVGYNGQASMTNTDGDIVPSSAVQFLDNIQFVDAFGQGVTGSLIGNISINWAYERIDTNFDNVTPVLTGDGAASAATGKLEASSASVGTSTIDSRDQIRYSNGRGFFSYYTASFNGAGQGLAGPHDDNDGFPIVRDLDADTFKFGYLKNGVLTGEVDIPYAALGVDPTALNIYAVVGGFLGVANPTLLIKKDTWVVGGVIKTEGTVDDTHVDLPAFPMRIQAINGMSVKSGSWHGGTVGEAGNVQDRGFSYPFQPFTGATTGDNPADGPRGQFTMTATQGEIHTAFIIQSKLLYNSLPNKIRADVVNVKVTVVPTGSGDGVVQAQLIGNAGNFSPSATYTDVSVSSTLEIDDNAGGQATGRYIAVTSDGTVVGEPYNIPYSSGQGNNPAQFNEEATLIQELQLDGIAGETLTLILRKDDVNVGVDIYWQVTWVERQI